MGRDKWKVGDLVQVESTHKTGWGDECHSHLVLILGKYVRKYPRTTSRQRYPITAELEDASRKRSELYDAVRDDGKHLKLALEDYISPSGSLIFRLVQRSCVEE